MSTRTRHRYRRDWPQRFSGKHTSYWQLPKTYALFCRNTRNRCAFNPDGDTFIPLYDRWKSPISTARICYVHSCRWFCTSESGFRFALSTAGPVAPWRSISQA
ncbi:hypothetical protein KCP69_10550 [Salmonella enterica subsp. enterica]|nr:hypothetical protein KCP69_10550 [Salmonella enterica subsp. enterica]